MHVRERIEIKEIAENGGKLVAKSIVDTQSYSQISNNNTNVKYLRATTQTKVRYKNSKECMNLIKECE